MKPLPDALGGLPDALRRRGLAHVLGAGTKYLRGRLPVELWYDVSLCVDPVGAADGQIAVSDPGALEVTYSGSNPLSRQLDAYARRIASPAGRVSVYRDATIVGSRPLVGLGDRYFSASWFDVEMPFFTQEREELKRNLPLSVQLRDAPPSDSIDAGFLLLTERGSNFHHWFFEVLPKLWWYDELVAELDRSPRLITHSPLTRFQSRSLELLGYDPDAVVTHTRGRSRVDRLYLAPHPIRLKGNQLNSLPSQLRWVGDRIAGGVADRASEFPDRVYISRQDATRRRVTNEDRVMESLSRLGFERCVPGQLSYEDQVRLFRGADVIVGPHGMGFTNLVYADDAAVIELFPENGATETYFVACSELSLEYELLECPAENSDANVRPRDRDLEVPITELTDVVSIHL